METLGWFALALGALSVVRSLLALPLFVGWLRRGEVRNFGAGETPPLSVLVPGAPDAFLRQNYPDYEVVADTSAAEQSDIEVLVGGEPRHEIVLAANPELRPDPLFLRDAVDGLATHRVVVFIPIACEAGSFCQLLRALSINSDAVLDALLFRGGGLRAAAVGRGSLHDGRGSGVARRGVRVRTPAIGWREIRTVPALILSVAPALLLICVVAGTRPGALTLLILITLLRAGIAVAIELRYVRDGSTVRALARLPLLWFAEPFLLLFGRSRAPELSATLDKR